MVFFLLFPPSVPRARSSALSNRLSPVVMRRIKKNIFFRRSSINVRRSTDGSVVKRIKIISKERHAIEMASNLNGRRERLFEELLKTNRCFSMNVLPPRVLDKRLKTTIIIIL